MPSEMAPSNEAPGLALDELLGMRRVPKGMSMAPGIRPPVGARAGKWIARGLDLDSITAYQPGDDVRTIDWRATARTQKLQVKRFIADAHIAQMLVVDLRFELLFATQTRPMAKTLALSAALLSWQALRFNEPLGMIILPNGPYLPPRRGRAWLLKLFAALVDRYAVLEQQGDDAVYDSDQIETWLAGLAPGDGLVWLSDFAGTGALTASLRLQLGRRLDALAVIVDDPITAKLLPSGHYPFHNRQGEQAKPSASSSAWAVIDRNRAQMIKQQAEKRRRQTWLDFLDASWRVTTADDLIVAHA